MKEIRRISLLMGFLLSASALFAQLHSRAVEFSWYNDINIPVHSYERFLLSRKGVNKQLKPLVKDSLALRLADHFWKLKKYEHALFWYTKISDKASDQKELKQRIAELQAINGNYKEAASLYKSLEGWEKKQKGFERIAAMSRDSADWTIKVLTLDDKLYREFSPLLIDSTLYWSSNVKKAEWIPKLNWDGYRFVHILSSPDTFKGRPIQARNVWDSVHYFKEAYKQRLATQFENADTKQLGQYKHSNHLVGRTRFSSLSVANSLSNFNQAHLSYAASTAKAYLNVNKSYTVGEPQLRLLDIAEGEWRNGQVQSLRILSLVDSTISALHPAIHPNGKELVFSAVLPGGAGGYDLYLSEKQTDGNWSKPQPLTDLNSIGNELFPQFTPSGKLIFSSDGLPGYGGLDLFSALWENSRPFQMEHFPYPVNSRYDDFGWTEYPDGRKGYFSSDRNGDDDIFQFVYQPKFIPLSGKVDQDKAFGKNEPVLVKLFEVDEQGNQLFKGETKTNEQGMFVFQTKPNHQYHVQVVPSEQQMAQNIVVNVAQDKEIVLPNIQLTPVAITEKPTTMPTATVLSKVEEISAEDRKNGSVYAEEVKTWLDSATKVWVIHHAYDNVRVINKDLIVLNDVATFMNSDPSYMLRIVSAADCLGTERYNNKLSQQRSEHVRSKFGSDLQPRVQHFWVGKRNLLIPCLPEKYEMGKQEENRYTYLILSRSK